MVKILAAWAGLGTLLYTGVIPAPEWLRGFFGPDLIDGVRQFIGAVIVFIQVLKGAKIIKSASEAAVMSTGSQVKYAINPFAV